MSLFKIDYVVEKSIKINAPKATVWEHIIDSKKKNKWSPWFILDLETVQKSEWVSGTVWYKESWESDIIWVGEEITNEAKRNSFINTTLNFTKPFKSTSFWAIRLAENKWVTTVKWTLKWALPVFLFFIKKQMTFFIWQDFVRWLTMLKALVETWKLKTSTEFVWKVEMEDKHFINLSWKWTLKEISTKMWDDFKKLSKYLKSIDVQPISSFSIYENTDMINDYLEYRSCIEISNKDYNDLIVQSNLEYYFGILDKNTYLQTKHNWAYEFLWNTWTWSFMYAKAKNIKVDPKAKAIEIYEVWPMDVKNPDRFVTTVNLITK